MGVRDLLFIGLVLGGGAALAASLYPPRIDRDPRAAVKTRTSVVDDTRDTARKVDQALESRWNSEGLTPSSPAPDTVVLRRLALALAGTIPSLEEHRRLETFPAAERIDRYTNDLLGDRRFADYFAERFARSYVGTEGGPFLFFRRRRFLSWLSDQIHDGRPYDGIVRDLLAADGIWTVRPPVNFITVTYDPEKKYVDAERVAGRVARAFLGVRLDCAQCHDHPFASWKQDDFQGLAAFYGHMTTGLTGVYTEPGKYEITDRKTGKPKEFRPHVPFYPELLPPETAGTPQVRLAAWLTDPKNPSLARATVNRVWALMFGRPMVEPVDDLPPAEELPPALTILAEDFLGHGYDIKRLVRVIASTEAFRRDSTVPEGTDPAKVEASEKAWAVFPLIRLRPEQVVGSLLQSANLSTIDADSHIITRIGKTIGENQFLQRYGDSGEDEFDGRGGTIPQRLLMMNGEIVKDRTKAGMLNGATQIGYFAPDDEKAVSIAYLTVLSRVPTPEERRHFLARLAGSKGDKRGERMSDLLWSLVNSTEFSWNH